MKVVENKKIINNTTLNYADAEDALHIRVVLKTNPCHGYLLHVATAVTDESGKCLDGIHDADEVCDLVCLHLIIILVVVWV